MWIGPDVPSVGDMTWSQLHERMAFMANLIEMAADNPDVALDFNGDLADVERLFGGEEGLLLSLHQRWVTALTAKLDQVTHRGVPIESALTELAAEHRGLRAVLEVAARRSEKIRALQHHERRIIDLYGGYVAPWQTIA